MKLLKNTRTKPSESNLYKDNHLLDQGKTEKSLERIESQETLALNSTPTKNAFIGRPMLSVKRE